MTKQSQLKSNNNVVYSCIYHVIWCTKYRRPVLTSNIAQRLKQTIQQKADTFKANIIELEIMPDHVHLVVEIDPQFGIHRLIKNIKGYSSRILRQEFESLKKRLPTLWTNRYCVVTVGGAPLSVLKKYIEQQRNV
ncbi:MAG: IS200/IS605 family transposase [Ignavibacteriales bacterium]